MAPADRAHPRRVGFWVVSRHADIQAAADAARFSSERAPGADGGGTLLQDLPFGLAAGVLLNMMDDPRHHRIRRLVTPAVAPRALAAMEPELRTRSRHILDAVADRGGCDFLTEVAVELPLAGGGRPDGHSPRRPPRPAGLVQRHAGLRGSGAGPDQRDGRRRRRGHGRVRRRLVADQRRCPADDLLSTLAAATVEGDDGAEGGPLSDLELLMFFNLLVVAGSRRPATPSRWAWPP